MTPSLDMAHSCCPLKVDLYAPKIVHVRAESFKLSSGAVTVDHYECELCHTVVHVYNAPEAK